jgi:hypothetical protein
MDKACWKSYEDDGKSALALAYPIMSGKYAFGSCPQMDTCISRLSACKAAATSGSDLKDCSSTAVNNCFMMGDVCIEAANKVCAEGKTEDEAGFNNISAGGTKTSKQTEEKVGPRPILDFLDCYPFFILVFLMGGALYLKRE